MIQTATSNIDDVVRDNILRFLYELHRKARSPRSAGKGIRDLQRELKKRYGYKQQQVAANLDYLVQQNWAREGFSSRMYKSPGGTLQSAEKVTYKISHVGIDRLQHPSTFKRSDAHKMKINVTNVGGVTVVGDGNVVNTHFADLSRELEHIRDTFNESSLPDAQKLDAVSDVESLLSQLQKPEPNRSVVKSLWEGIQRAAAIASLSSATAQAAELISPLVGM